MIEKPTIVSERADDIPLVAAQMRRMDLPLVIDCYIVTHGNCQRLSPGWTMVVWLAHVLSWGDHRLNQVQPGRRDALETLRTRMGHSVPELDLSDDRLADNARWVKALRASTPRGLPVSPGHDHGQPQMKGRRTMGRIPGLSAEESRTAISGQIRISKPPAVASLTMPRKRH